MPGENTAAFNYGLGVIVAGPWISQSLGFARWRSGVVGYLPAQKLTIAVEATNGPGAYDEQARAGNADRAVAVFHALADALAPNTLPALSH